MNLRVRACVVAVGLTGLLGAAWALQPAAAVKAAASRAEGTDPKSWNRLVSILQYMETDYPAAVKSGAPTELAEQLSFVDEARSVVREELGPAGQAFLPRFDAMRAQVAAGKDPERVSRTCADLVEELVAAGGLSRSPRHPPDLENGRHLYAAGCAACHGALGDAKVALANELSPRPANLLSSVMDTLTPYKVFNVLTFGVTGTSMPEYSGLSEKERWDLAFFTFTLRQPPCAGAAPKVSLDALANTPDPRLALQFGADRVGCLRGKIPAASEEESLSTARAGIETSLKLASEGNRLGARQAILDAYLMGIEPVEPLLRSRDAELVTQIEQGFLRTRVAAEQDNHAKLGQEGKALLVLLDRARRGGSAVPRTASVFWLALLVVVREGFEATIVVAALLAVLKKMQQEEQARVVHVGWVSALVMGAVAYLFGRKLLAGANRELLEGFAALVASVMLVYAALWLNARSNIRKFMGELRQKMQGALGRGSTLGLFFIAFMAVFRESFETALFLEGLSIDSSRGVLYGAGAGVAVMVGLTVFIGRVGYKLPMKAMFSVSTVLLYVTAVALAGKGVHALQEVGMLPLRPVPMVTVDLLGIFPDLLSLTPQLLLALAPFAWRWIRRAPSEHDGPGLPNAQHNT